MYTNTQETCTDTQSGTHRPTHRHVQVQTHRHVKDTHTDTHTSQSFILKRLSIWPQFYPISAHISSILVLTAFSPVAMTVSSIGAFLSIAGDFLSSGSIKGFTLDQLWGISLAALSSIILALLLLFFKTIDDSVSRIGVVWMQTVFQSLVLLPISLIFDDW